MLGTHWEQKHHPKSHPFSQKEKGVGPFGSMLTLLIGSQEFLCLLPFFTIVGVGVKTSVQIPNVYG
jgi:hypothetical protein